MLGKRWWGVVVVGGGGGVVLKGATLDSSIKESNKDELLQL